MEKKKKGKKALKVILIIVVVLVLFVGISASVFFGVFHKGNGGAYSLKKVETIQGSPLEGKTILFLGSSVTAGFSSMGVSFVDYIEKIDGIHAIKEAVSGTTLVDNGDKSYVQRLINNVDTDIKLDAMVCQLSTNDATNELPLGAVSSSDNLESFDTSTIIGAMEYIIVYTQQTWSCPVMFYTSSYYDSPYYASMVKALYELQKKWDIGIIDLWNDSSFNAISDDQRALYMKDDIHPTRAGYLLWWTPVMRQDMIAYLG